MRAISGIWNEKSERLENTELTETENRAARKTALTEDDDDG